MTWIAALVFVGAGALVACGLFGRERVWEKQKGRVEALGTLGDVWAPETLRHHPDEDRESGDVASFVFRRVHDTHLNGQTSYAEHLEIRICAEDAPFPMGEGRWEWSVASEIYDRHPVREPSWRVKLIDRETRAILDWRGFQKQYSVETAKRNLEQMARTVRVRERKAYFAAHRDWPTDGWRENLTANLSRMNRELAVMGMPPAVQGRWTKVDEWRYTVDGERPQRFLLAYQLGTEAKPDFPVDFHGPVTKYTFVDGRVWQQNQGGAGGMLAEPEIAQLRQEWTQQGNVYYYSVQTVNLWGTPDGASVRAMMARARQLEAEHKAGRLVNESPRR